jgi:hypothetical protein
MDNGQKILSEVKARQQRQQEERTVKRVKQLRRQASQQIRTQKIEQEIRVLKEEKRSYFSHMCGGIFCLLGVFTFSAFLFGFLQARTKPKVHKHKSLVRLFKRLNTLVILLQQHY